MIIARLASSAIRVIRTSNERTFERPTVSAFYSTNARTKVRRNAKAYERNLVHDCATGERQQIPAVVRSRMSDNGRPAISADRTEFDLSLRSVAAARQSLAIPRSSAESACSAVVSVEVDAFDPLEFRAVHRVSKADEQQCSCA